RPGDDVCLRAVEPGRGDRQSGVRGCLRTLARSEPERMKTGSSRLSGQLCNSTVQLDELDSADGGQKVGAGLLTTAAGISTDFAVLVHVRVLLALIGAFLACSPAGLQQGLDGRQVLAGASAEDGAGGLADIGTIEIEPDRVAQVSDHVLSKAGIRAGGAGLGSFKTGGDTVGEFLHVKTAGVVGVGFSIEVIWLIDQFLSLECVLVTRLLIATVTW